MRIPTLDMPGAPPSQQLFSNTGPTLQRDSGALAEGYNAAMQGHAAIRQSIKGVTGGLQNIGKEISASEERESRARKEADATVIMMQRAGVEEDVAKDMSEFMATEGMSASERSKDTMDALEKAVNKRRERLNPQQQQLFDASVAGLHKEWTVRIESHTATQNRVAAKASLNSLKQKNLDAIGNFPAGFPLEEEMVADRTQTLVVAARALGRSAEEKDAAEAQVRSDVAMARIGRSLRNEDPVTAKKQLEAFGDTISHKNRGEIQDRVNSKLEAKLGNDAAAEREMTLSLMANASRNGDGIIDVAKFNDAFNKLEPAERAKAHTLYSTLLTESAERQTALVDDWKNKANAAIVNRRPIDAGVWKKLEQYDGTFLRGVLEAERKENDRIRAKLSGNTAEARAAVKAQRDDDAYVEQKFMNLPEEQREKENIDAFAATLGVRLSRNGKATVEGRQQTAKDSAGKKETSGSDKFSNDFETALRKVVDPPKKGEPPTHTAEEVAAIRGEAAIAYEEKTKEFKRPLTETERIALVGEQLAPVVVQKKRFGKDVSAPAALVRSKERAEEQLKSNVVTTKVEMGGLPTVSVKMKFPNGEVADVPADKLEVARRKGGVEVSQ